MNSNKLLITLLLFFSLASNVYADMVSGPEILIIGVVFLAILGLIVAGIGFAAYLILKWIKKKYTKK